MDSNSQPQNPSTAPQRVPPQQPPSGDQQSSNSVNALSVVGLVLFFVPVIGLLVSIFARKKSKNMVALMGVILGSIITLIFMAGLVRGIFSGNTSTAGSAAKDNERTVDTKYLGASIEKYVAQKDAYPESLDNLSILSGFDMEALKTPEGGSYNYDVKPTGCNKAKDCTGYRVYTTGSDGKPIEFSNSVSLH